MTAPRCSFAFGQHRCGAVLEEFVDRLGRVRWVCQPCERRKAKICRDCPAPVAGTRTLALRCEPCRRRKAAKTWATARVRDPERYRHTQNSGAKRRRDQARGGPLTPAMKAAIGTKRGLARAAALTPERRSEIARMGHRARFPHLYLATPAVDS